jgi:hypothetical protein
MEIARLVLEFTRTLAWPLVVLAALLLFRLPISGFIERLQSIEGPGGIKACAREVLYDVADRAERLSESFPPGSPETEAVGDLQQRALKGLGIFGGQPHICGAMTHDGTSCQNFVRRRGERCRLHRNRS